MLNWAGHPRVQSQMQGDYSRFAGSGIRLLGLLVIVLFTVGVYAADDESGSILADDEQPTETLEVTQEIADEASAPAEPAQPVEPAPQATAAASPTSPELNSTVPLRYVVKKGDTLWDIADHFLKQPWKWPELWYGNPDIKNPHLIYPGDVLYLTYVDGKPRLSREPPAHSGVEKLSPRVRVEDLDDAIPTIPGDAIHAFLRGARVVGADELDAAPYIVEFIGEHLIGGANISAYVKGLDANADTNHSIVRKGEVLRDPETEEILGYEAAYIGTARVLTPDRSAARVRIESSVREVLIGDRLLPLDETDLIAAAFYPHAPDSAIDGYIIAVTDGVSQIGQYQIVTLSKGARDGVEIGHVFSIYQAGRAVRDPYGKSANATVTLPEEKAGLMMVFKTYERVSYALVMKSTRAIHLLDTFHKPED